MTANNTKKCKKRANARKKTQKQRPNCTQSPQSPLTREDFLLLQKSWYDKLADDGFKDLEIFNFRPSNPNAGEPSPLIHGYSLRQIGDMKHWSQGYHYYARLRCYLVHNPNWCGPYALPGLVARLYTDGIPYSGIVRAVKAAGLKDNMNKWHVHHIVHDFVAKATAWNKKDARGLDYETF